MDYTYFVLEASANANNLSRYRSYKSFHKPELSVCIRNIYKCEKNAGCIENICESKNDTCVIYCWLPL